MPLPENFSPWEHLQSVIMQVHNRIVREEFNDVIDDDDISTPRASLKTACLLRDDDSILQTLIRYWLFYVDLRKAQDLQIPIYGIPISSFQEERKFKPQITLHFLEDPNDVEEGYPATTGEISFRLMNQTTDTLSQSDVMNYANRIRSAFASGAGFVWQKGKVMCSYSDWGNGYQLQLLCRSSTEGRRIIEQVLDIQGHLPQWEKMNVNQNEAPTAAYPTIPETQVILGRSRRLPRRRPTADVRFQYALLHVHGVPNPICLVDRTGAFRNPVTLVA